MDHTGRMARSGSSEPSGRIRPGPPGPTRRSSTSAGLLVYRSGGPPARRDRAAVEAELQVLIVHPGGPWWARRDEGSWSVPKGEHDPDDDPAGCARREFEEELGVPVPPGPWIDLGEVVQAGGKRVRAWAVAGEVEAGEVRSNTFELEWPPRSGRRQRFPEVDRAAWVDPPTARRKLVPAQAAFVDRLIDRLTPPPR